MKKNYCSVITLSTLMFFASCSNSTKTTDQGVQKVDSLPRNPTSGQVYHDSNGHNWVYDMAMGAWIMNTINGSSGRSNNYYYYPSTGYYTDGTGRTVTPPASVKTGISDGVKARTQTVTKTKVNLSKPSTSSSSNIKSLSSSSSKPTGRSVFGSTGRSSSIGS